jgi:hypothetical protein
MMDAIYRVDGHRVVTSPDAAGPWDAGMQHGSAPAALVVWAAEAIPTPEPMQIARVTIDLMRPVPVAPLTIEREILREGRKIQLCAIKLLADGVVVVGATVLKIKTPWRCRLRSRICRSNCRGPINRWSNPPTMPAVHSRSAFRCAPRMAASAWSGPPRSGFGSTSR